MFLKTDIDSPRKILSLDGDWQFAIDTGNNAPIESFVSSEFNQTTTIPASFAEQQIGEPSSGTSLAGWEADYAYEGKVWYTRTIEIPQDLHDHSFELILRGVRWRSEVWLDGNYIGRSESLSTPHHYDVTSYINAGSQQRLTICIDNRMLYPLQESHVNSAETATRWGGITGGIDLLISHRSMIKNIHCIPDIHAKQFNLRIQTSPESTDFTLAVNITDPDSGNIYSASSIVSDTETSLAVSIGDDTHLWWDDEPFLYDAQIILSRGDQVLDRIETRLGLREISTEGKHILLNGKPVFLRGYVDCCIFPQTGYPSWDIEHYRRQFEIVRSYGFNHVRLHSWTPPQPFWIAADEAGMLVQTELPHWSCFYDYAETPAPEDVQTYLSAELDAIIETYQCHPSWVLFANGNELIGSAAGHPDLMALVKRGKSQDSTRLYTDNTGFGRIPAPERDVDFYIQSCNWHPPHKIYDAASADTSKDFSAITAMADRPLIGHEHGQFTMYVRPSEAKKYQGVIKPTWLNSVESSLKAKNLLDRVDDFIMASGTHIVRTYKENIERARRTRSLAGVQLLDIRDFPGQGHATTGILDMFWDSKGLIAPETFAQFNGAVTLLMRSPSPTFWTGKDITLKLEVSNYGREHINDAILQWRLEDQLNDISYTGEIVIGSAPVGEITMLPELRIPTDADSQAHAWKFTVSLNDVHNEWHLWSYPYPKSRSYAGISSNIESLRHVLIDADFSDDFAGTMMNMHGDTRRLTDAKLAIANRLSLRLLQYLVDGGRVWLMPDSKQLYDFVRTRYLPPFWSYLHFPDNVSSVMGTIVNQHPVLDQFPHDGFSDWQWYDIVNDSPAICLDSVPFIEPLVEVVDNFNRAKRLTYAFEATVGKGQLFVSTWQLHNLAVIGKPEVRYLLHMMTDYLCSDTISHSNELTVAQVLGLFKLTNGLVAELE